MVLQCFARIRKLLHFMLSQAFASIRKLSQGFANEKIMVFCKGSIVPSRHGHFASADVGEAG